MDSFERYQDLQRLLASCHRDQLKAREQLLRDRFEERAMKWRFFRRENWPPLSANMTWKSSRKALRREPALKTIYISANREKLYKLLQIETPDALLRQEKSIRDRIDQLPPVEVTRTELRAGSERVLDAKFSVRVYIPLSNRGGSKGPEELGHAREAHVADSLDGYAALKSRPNTKQLRVWNILRSSHFAENSNISTEERAVQGHREQIFDKTVLSMIIVLSQHMFHIVNEMSCDWLSNMQESDQRSAVLAIDVPSDTHLIQRQLGKGEGMNFQPISSAEKKIDGFHLHLRDGTNAPVHSFALSEANELI